MKALGIRQPWAWLICAGYKDIENRNFDAPRVGRIYVHAGKKPDMAGAWALWGNSRLLDLLDDVAKIQIPNLTTFWDTSAIIGEVEIKYVTTHSKSPWFAGPIGYVLANPVLYETPIPCKGKLGFFEPDIRKEPDDKENTTRTQ